MKVGIVAGEKSGDYLGAELIKAIKQRYPNAEFIGLAGPLMQQAGAQSLAEMEKISIMGIMGALKGLREILLIRKRIKNHMLAWQPDVFVGIDVPDFNLSLEAKLKQAGIPTVHYVSPTVWAWREKRIVKIKRAVDLMLTLFPFEAEFYKRHNTPVEYVGHPLAKSVQEWKVDAEFSQRYLSMPKLDDCDARGANKNGDKIIAIMPGSRMSEVSRLAPIMLQATIELKNRDLKTLKTKPMPEPEAGLQFLIPAANEKIKNYLAELANTLGAPVTIVDGHSRDVLSVCHIAVLASGTAALEAALFAKPMVVMYKVPKLEEWYAARTMIVKHFSMPNHLTQAPVVPELIQENANVENLVSNVVRLLVDSKVYAEQYQVLKTIAPMLSENSGQLACDAIRHLLELGANE